MNELTRIYKNNNIRIVEKDGKPWFVAKDIAKILEYKKTEAMTRRLADDEKDAILNSTLGGNQKTTIINLYGLFAAILGSNKKEAIKFQRWVTHEVLPSIQETGSYSIQQQTPILTTNAIYQDVTNRMKEEIKKAMDDLEKLEDLPNRKKLIELIPRLTDYQCGELIRVSWRRWGKPDHSELPE